MGKTVGWETTEVAPEVAETTDVPPEEEWWEIPPTDEEWEKLARDYGLPVDVDEWEDLEWAERDRRLWEMAPRYPQVAEFYDEMARVFPDRDFVVGLTGEGVVYHADRWFGGITSLGTVGTLGRVTEVLRTMPPTPYAWYTLAEATRRAGIHPYIGMFGPTLLDRVGEAHECEICGDGSPDHDWLLR